MRPGSTLQPDSCIAHYRVVGPLGAGGMGEVYLAQDQTLERSVALKILPPELTHSQERVRRFVQEAKSASSLNHPNIVTIYEIGQDRVRAAGGQAEPESGPVQYISMELVNGRTLAVKIHDEKTDLRTLLGYLAQAAEGIAKAHAAGIVHRDLKPGNIMVSEDGFAKVLDFGLSKLLERRASDPEASTAPTQTGEQTSEGAVLGTVGYMSPEQVQGRAVDQRSDVFSFGCILYEAATRRRPFTADSNVETLHKILHDKPAPIEEINASVPAELRRLVRRCLAKNPDQRVQSMKDLAIELREIAEEYEALSASASSGSGAPTAALAVGGRRAPLATILAVAAVVTLAALVFGWYGIQRARREAGGPASLGVRAVPETSRGDIHSCALSADGRYLAYVAGPAAQVSLHVRQVATGSDVEVLPPGREILEFVAFSPDGDYVFYTERKADAPNYRRLLRVPSLGGPSQECAFDVDSRPSFSPDGRRVCFLRGFSQSGITSLRVMELEGRKERELANVKRPVEFSSPPAWSPDGRHIAIFEQDPTPRYAARLVVYDERSGGRQELFRLSVHYFGDLAWLPGGKELAALGVDPVLGLNSQIYRVAYPGGGIRRVTNDNFDYWSLTAAGSEEALAVSRQSALANVWAADVSSGEAGQLTSFTTDETSPGMAAGDAEAVVFESYQDQSLGLWLLPFTGGAPRRISTGEGFAGRPYLASGRVIFSLYDLTGNTHVCSVAPDGSGLGRLTDGPGEELIAVSEAGGYALFGRADSVGGVWSVPLAGGPARLIAPGAAPGGAQASPDGRLVGVVDYTPGPAGLTRWDIRVIPAGGGPAVARVHIPEASAGLAWNLANESVLFLDRADSTHNVARLAFAGGAPERVTAFREGVATRLALSPDGRRLAVVRRFGKRASLWIAGADGSQPVQVRGSETDAVFDLRWTTDSRRVLFCAGNQYSDAVVLRNFR